jgi:6,7-dimethyl-8-ribityllumazine synthase
MNKGEKMKILEGHLTGKGKKFGLVVGRFNELISTKLVEGAIDCLIRHGVEEEDITLCKVPGAFEIPLMAGKLAGKEEVDAVIALGAVIRGATPHFDYISAEVSKGIAAVGLETGKPVIFGVLTCDSIEQALERAGTKAGNKGWDAALNAIEMVDLMGKIT